MSSNIYSVMCVSRVMALWMLLTFALFGVLAPTQPIFPDEILDRILEFAIVSPALSTIWTLSHVSKRWSCILRRNKDVIWRSVLLIDNPFFNNKGDNGRKKWSMENKKCSDRALFLVSFFAFHLQFFFLFC